MSAPLADDWDEPPPPRIFFSGVEVLHLLASVVVLTLAFTLVLGARKDADFGLSLDVKAMLRLLPYAAAMVVPAFILHELAHKVVAQRKDMWAEFRANFFGLVGGFMLTAFTGVMLAIPGAVHIVGYATKRDAGVISIWGPLVNLVIGFGALGLGALLPPIKLGDYADFYQLIGFLNGILAAFNMLPIGPLDGLKVWRWSKAGFFGMWALTVALVLASVY